MTIPHNNLVKTCSQHLYSALFILTFLVPSLSEAKDTQHLHDAKILGHSNHTKTQKLTNRFSVTWNSLHATLAKEGRLPKARRMSLQSKFESLNKDIPQEDGRKVFAKTFAKALEEDPNPKYLHKAAKFAHLVTPIVAEYFLIRLLDTIENKDSKLTRNEKKIAGNSLFTMGTIAESQDNMVEAITLYEEALTYESTAANLLLNALDGDNQSQMLAAASFENGWGEISPSDDLALKYYKKAWKSGKNIDALIHIVELLARINDKDAFSANNADCAYYSELLRDIQAHPDKLGHAKKKRPSLIRRTSNTLRRAVKKKAA